MEGLGNEGDQEKGIVLDNKRDREVYRGSGSRSDNQIIVRVEIPRKQNYLLIIHS
jgi:hypothetical protein